MVVVVSRGRVWVKMWVEVVKARRNDGTRAMEGGKGRRQAGERSFRIRGRRRRRGRGKEEEEEEEGKRVRGGGGGWVTKGTRGRKRITDSPVWA